MFLSDDAAIHLFVKQKYQKSFGQNIIGDKSAGVMLHKGLPSEIWTRSYILI